MPSTKQRSNKVGMDTSFWISTLIVVKHKNINKGVSSWRTWRLNYENYFKSQGL